MMVHLQVCLLNNRLIRCQFLICTFLLLCITGLSGQEKPTQFELRSSVGANLTQFKQKRVLLGQTSEEGVIERSPFLPAIPLTLGVEFKKTLGAEFEYNVLLFSQGSAEKRYRLYCLTNPSEKISPVIGISYFNMSKRDARIALGNDTTIAFHGIGYELGLKAKKFKFDVILYSFSKSEYEPFNEFTFPLSGMSIRVTYELFRLSPKRKG